MNNYKTLVSIIGPTAVGKTFISIFLAEKFSSEILSCDSRQFFKNLKIGTSQPNEKDLNRIKHHFIGNLNIDKIYTAGDFEKDALNILKNLFFKYSIVIMVGGSTLYEKAITQGLDYFPKVNINIYKNLYDNFKKKGILFLQKELKYHDPEYYEEVDIFNYRRLIRALGIIKSSNTPYSFFRKKKYSINRFFNVIKIGLNIPREILYKKINSRVDKMIKKGLLEEARIFYPYRNLNSLKTIGYKEIFKYFDGYYNLEKAIEEIKKNSRRYAKKQITWYKKDKKINWFSPYDEYKILNFIKKKIEIKI